MTLSPPTRKRTRSCEEEEFLPLSKKINNLHINNWGKVDPPQEHLVKWNNPSEELANFYSEELSNGRQGTETRNTSLYKNVQGNIQNGYNETELIQHFKHINNGTYKNSNYSEEKYANGESGSTESGHSSWSPMYNPDLDVNENPYYYESNKLLFDLYVERLQRNSY
ncbi:hypothetical protein RUM43_004790 [Polyplax serrata]|uniref:Uncharacterized protein n=1 Tax=Polyplax serrata TaxID=468196 RepID=A0AAN8XMH1_POLSC